MSNIIIRQAVLLDAARLVDLFNSDDRVTGDVDALYELSDIAEYIHDRRKNIIVALKDDYICGALMADDHDTYSYLAVLVVAPECQRSGIGTALFDHYQHDLQARDIPFAEAMAETGHPVMEKILEKRGFKKCKNFTYWYRKQG